MRHAYALKWNLFVEWCSSHREVPRKCPIRVGLSYLQQGLGRRLSPSTLKVYVAAIAATTPPEAVVPAHSSPEVAVFAHKAPEAAAVSTHDPPTLPAPPWHPCLPLPPGPLPLHWPGPPSWFSSVPPPS